MQSERDKLRYIAHSTQNENDWNKFRAVRNNLKKIIKSAKKRFYTKALSSKNPKEVWQVIHRILKPSDSRISANPSQLGEYFSSTAPRVTGKDTARNLSSFVDSLKEHDSDHLFTLSQVSSDDIQKHISKLRNDCSTGDDTIPTKFIKPVAEYLAPVLADIINQAITQRTFPELWKIARVSAVPKVKNPVQPCDFRPISILPVMSKIFERVVLSQLSTLIDQEKLYKETQSGYLRGHSCVTLLTKMKDDIQKAMNRGEITLSICADFSKAFDTVCYETLFNKLITLKFSKQSIELLYSYLSNRVQYVQINDQKSSKSTLKYGVPQGSILGPILFNLYVSDLSDNLSSTCLQFADDTTIYQHCKINNIDSCSRSLQKDLASLLGWSGQSNLVLNETKTKTMLFCTPQMNTRHNLSDKTTYDIQCNSYNLERVQTTKLLGIIFSENLTWNDHLQKLITSLYSTLRTLRQFKRLTNFSLRKQLAETLVLSQIDFGNIVYNNIPKYLMKRLQKVKNSTAGYVLNRYASEKDVLSLNWLPIGERIDLAILGHVHKALHDPNWPQNLKINYVNPVRTLRSNANNKLIEPSFEKGTLKKRASELYNKLSNDIKSNDSLKSFKKQVKNLFKNDIFLIEK